MKDVLSGCVRLKNDGKGSQSSGKLTHALRVSVAFCFICKGCLKHLVGERWVDTGHGPARALPSQVGYFADEHFAFHTQEAYVPVFHSCYLLLPPSFLLQDFVNNQPLFGKG